MGQRSTSCLRGRRVQGPANGAIRFGQQNPFACIPAPITALVGSGRSYSSSHSLSGVAEGVRTFDNTRPSTIPISTLLLPKLPSSLSSSGTRKRLGQEAESGLLVGDKLGRCGQDQPPGRLVVMGNSDRQAPTSSHPAGCAEELRDRRRRALRIGQWLPSSTFAGSAQSRHLEQGVRRLIDALRSSWILQVSREILLPLHLDPKLQSCSFFRTCSSSLRQDIRHHEDYHLPINRTRPRGHNILCPRRSH